MAMAPFWNVCVSIHELGLAWLEDSLEEPLGESSVWRFPKIGGPSLGVAIIGMIYSGLSCGAQSIDSLISL